MSAETTRPRIPMLLLLVAVSLLAFQLRSPLVALAPVARQAEAGWGITPAAFGLLTTVPLLCFSLSTPIAPWLARRVGVEAAIAICAGGIIAGTVLRSIGPFGVAIAGVVVLGLAITIGNVLVPVVIRRDVPLPRRGLATGVYAALTNVGTMVTSFVTVPLALAFGWRAATAAWSVAGVLTVAVWVVALRRARGGLEEEAPTAPTRFRVDGLVVMLALAFAAQAASYYGVTAWLPTLLADERGYSAAVAGTSSAVFQLMGIVGAIGMPVLALRLRPRTVVAFVGLLWVSLPMVLLVAPEHFLIGSITGGIAQGGGFTAIMTIIAEVGGDARRTTALSAVVQSVGYLVAAAAPPVVGGVHSLAGNWIAPMLVVLGTTSAFLVLGVLAATRASRLRP